MKEALSGAQRQGSPKASETGQQAITVRRPRAVQEREESRPGSSHANSSEAGPVSCFADRPHKASTNTAARIASLSYGADSAVLALSHITFERTTATSRLLLQLSCMHCIKKRVIRVSSASSVRGHEGVPGDASRKPLRLRAFFFSQPPVNERTTTVNGARAAAASGGLKEEGAADLDWPPPRTVIYLESPRDIAASTQIANGLLCTDAPDPTPQGSTLMG